MERFGVIYLITNTINGKKYVGQTVVSAQDRWKYHIKFGARYSAVHHAITKYGVSNFSFQEIATAFDAATLDQLEEYFIQFYDTWGQNGYNLTKGGNASRGTLTAESRARISQSKKGNKYRKNANKNGRLLFKSNSHVQRLGDDPSAFKAAGDYKSPTSPRYPSKYIHNRNKIIDLYNDTNSTHKVASILGVEKTQVQRYLRVWGVLKSKSLAASDRNKRRYIVKDETQNLIIQTYLTSKSISEVVRKLNMSYKTIQRVLKGKNIV